MVPWPLTPDRDTLTVYHQYQVGIQPFQELMQGSGASVPNGAAHTGLRRRFTKSSKMACYAIRADLAAIPTLALRSSRPAVDPRRRILEGYTSKISCESGRWKVHYIGLYRNGEIA